MRVGIKGIHIVPDVVFDKPKGPSKEKCKIILLTIMYCSEDTFQCFFPDYV